MTVETLTVAILTCWFSLFWFNQILSPLWYDRSCCGSDGSLAIQPWPHCYRCRWSIHQPHARDSAFAIVYGCFSRIKKNARPNWPLACPCSSEILLLDPQSSELPLGSSCAKHVYTYDRHTNVEEGLTHDVSSEMLRTFSPWYFWTRIRIRIRIILFWQHTTYRNSNVYKKKNIITYMPTWRLLLRPFMIAIIGPPEK